MRRDGRSVLVVDDDSLNRVVLSKLLEHDGYRARTAVDGLEALAALDGETFDALLLDIVMPKIDGLEVLRRVKADPRWWHIPVIVISAVDDIDSIVACLELGADDYVQKPFDPVLLRARLNACLARHRFHVLEVEYHKMVEEQADELDALKRSLDAGAAAVGGAPPARRGPVAVLVTGLGGGGALAGEGDAAGVLAVVEELHAAVDALGGRFGAAVAGRAGAVVTLVFNESGPDPAAAAVGMAVALGKAMATRLASIGDGAAEVRWGAGIGLGEAIVGLVGRGESSHLTAVGAAVDRATELGDLGRHQGAILLDEAAATATRHLDAEVVGHSLAVPVPEPTWRLLDTRPTFAEES